jgi:hypothetical protein
MTSRSRNASPQFRSIKAVFEQANAPTTPPRPFSRASRPQTPTDDEPSPVAGLISRETFKHQQETIDTLLEASSTRRWPTPIPTPAPRDPLRPKSSWIGPPPPARLPLPSFHSSAAVMPRKVTIAYSHPGLQPPVYITTSLSDPQWDLLEMGCSESPSGEWEFTKTFHAADGEYQYKFRLGPGDWWVCDESKPTVDDGFGDRNNVLVVDDDEADFEAPTMSHERNVAKGEVKHDSPADDAVQEKHGSAHNALEVPPEDVPVNFSRQDTLAVDDDEGDCEPSHFPGAPTFSHEKDVLPERIPTPGADEGEDDDDMEHPPLMRHETLSSDSGKSPLEAEKNWNIPTSPQSSHSATYWTAADHHVPPEADPNDPSLVKLDVLSSTSPMAKSVSHSSQPPSLPRVLEDEEELEDDTIASPDTYTHAESLGSKVQNLTTAGLQTLAGNSERPAALMTPPRTPDDSEAPKSIGTHLEAVKSAAKQRTKDLTGLDGDAQPGPSTETDESEESTSKKAEKEASEKPSRSGMFETALGLGLFVAVGVGAAWLAFMMQDVRH